MSRSYRAFKFGSRKKNIDMVAEAVEDIFQIKFAERDFNSGTASESYYTIPYDKGQFGIYFNEREETPDGFLWNDPNYTDFPIIIYIKFEWDPMEKLNQLLKDARVEAVLLSTFFMRDRNTPPEVWELPATKRAKKMWRDEKESDDD